MQRVMSLSALTLLACLTLTNSLDAADKKKVAFMAGTKSHGYGSHEHYAGCVLLAKSLEQAMPDIETVVYQNGWPKDRKAFDDADTIVMYCDGGGRHPVNQHLAQIDELVKEKQVGIVCLHYGVEVPKSPSGEKFLDWIGGYFEADWSVNPHWTANFTNLPDHPISNGVEPFAINDEWYYHMRFPQGMKGVTPILSDHPPKETLSRPDGAHSGNPHVRKAVANGEIQHVAWAFQRPDGGRGFGFTGGHYHWNWGDPNFRKVLLNAIVWTARADVPENGVSDMSVSVEDLEANQDYPQPPNFDRNSIRRQLKNVPAKNNNNAAPTGRKAVKPAFQSQVVTPKTSGHAVVKHGVGSLFRRTCLDDGYPVARKRLPTPSDQHLLIGCSTFLRSKSNAASGSKRKTNSCGGELLNWTTKIHRRLGKKRKRLLNRIRSMRKKSDADANNTENGFHLALAGAGVPEVDIVAAFQSPEPTVRAEAAPH